MLKKKKTHQCIKKSIPKINSDYAIWPVFNTVSSSVNESQYYFEDLHKYVLLFSIQITEHGLSSLIHNYRKIIPWQSHFIIFQINLRVLKCFLALLKPAVLFWHSMQNETNYKNCLWIILANKYIVIEND